MNYVPFLGGSRTWTTVIAKKWWPPQQRALRVVSGYLASNTKKQAMVRMPTGTGKTLVIATLAQLLKDHRHVLIVAPWENLVQQLERETSSRVWQKLGEESSLKARPSRTFTPKSLEPALKELASEGVLLCTQQTLHLVHNDATLFARLARWVSLALVDEGHREPAPQWANAVRALKCPTVLFTATPYRNDLRYFEVDRTHLASYTFEEALEDNVVRHVEFMQGSWPRGSARSVAAFVDELLAARNTTEKRVGLSAGSARVIVRCATKDEIKEVVRVLEGRGEAAIGIHDRFLQADGKLLRHSVPDPQAEKASFWVHQHKLTEGLDDPAFRIVAIYGPFPNARSLVQQIGRVIRNPTRTAKQKAFVLAHQQEHQHELWNRFSEYERDVRRRNEEGKSELTAFDEFVTQHASPPHFYLLGDFRRHLRADEVKDPRDVVLMRKSVLARELGAKFDWDRLIAEIEDNLIGGEVLAFGQPFRSSDTYLQLFQVYEQSAVVRDAYLELRLGYVFARTRGSHLYFSDSEGRVPEALRMSTSPIAPDILHRLFPDDDKTAIKEVSLINGDFGSHAFRRRVVSTDSLQSVPPALSDYVQVCSNATGSVVVTGAVGEERRRRYLSFTTGRLSERSMPVANFDDFSTWLAQIHSALNNNRAQGDDTLLRFATPHSYDGTEEPRHILFDLTSEGLDISALPGPSGTTNVDDLWVVDRGAFRGELDERPFGARVVYNADTRRFVIESDDLDQVKLQESGRSFTEHLNETQNFRLLLGRSTIYTQGCFFTPNLLPWRGGGTRWNIERIVSGCTRLANITSEKGDATGWTENSVFGALPAAGGVFADAGQPDVLVCNDVGAPEMADFLALYARDKRIAMIHCKKARSGSSMSASAFHDVCSQAVRYLGFFNPTDRDTKLKSAQVSDSWCPDAARHPEVKRLVLPRSGVSATSIVKKFADAIADPTFTREVWLVMGNGLSKAEFEKAISKNRPKPNERELSYLFQSTWCAVASVGASLKVFCMP